MRPENLAALLISGTIHRFSIKGIGLEKDTVIPLAIPFHIGHRNTAGNTVPDSLCLYSFPARLGIQ